MGARPWRVLVVDDDKDMHAVTRLSLRSRQWRQRGFELTDAYSGSEARELLTERGPSYFDAAVIDVVMETASAGLDLCAFIRRTCDRKLRIILRTGQPGAAPEEQILQSNDVDYYLAKSEATASTLFALLRACLRSSLDIATTRTFERQMRLLADELRVAKSTSELAMALKPTLLFLEDKHGLQLLFVPHLGDGTEDDAVISAASECHRAGAVVGALRAAHAAGVGEDKLLHGRELNLEENERVFLFSTRMKADGTLCQGGFVCASGDGTGADELDLERDLQLAIESWRTAHQSFWLQGLAEKHHSLYVSMYQERAKSIALAVSSVAHDVNTPIGVAMTAVSTIPDLVKSLRPNLPRDSQTESVLADLDETIFLLQRNLVSARKLLRGFQSVNANHASLDRQSVDLAATIEDCVVTMKPLLSRRRIDVKLDVGGARDPKWLGYPGHLSQVLTNLFQNTLRYAYDVNEPGVVDIVAEVRPENQTFLITFRDHGKGIDAELLPRIFDPLVTTGQDCGGTGLGLAICARIVNEICSGSIHCESAVGEGTTFLLRFPVIVPRAEEQGTEESESH